MKLKFEIEADENGYIQKLFRDGEVIHQSKHVRNNTGSQKVSGDDEEDLPDDILDNFPTFFGFNLMLYAEKESE